MFSPVHPDRHKAEQFLCGGAAVTDRLANAVGFVNVTLNLEVFGEMEKTEKEDYVKNLLRKKVNSFQRT